MNKRRFILAGLVIVLVAGAGLTRFLSSSNTAAQTSQRRDTTTPVTTTVARSEDFAIRRRTIGILESPATVVVKSRIESQVTQQHVKDGQLVKKGDLLFTLDDREVKAMIARDEAQIARDQASVLRTQNDLDRYQRLTAVNASPRQQLDQAVADNKIAIANVEAGQAQLRADNLKLDFITIEAPIDGRIGAIRVTPGNLISVNDPTGLLTITQLRPIRVAFTLAERDLAALRKASRATTAATVRLYVPGASDPLATGELDFVDSTVDTASGTIAAKAKFANDNFELWPGMYVDVEIDLDVRPKTVMIPAVAIQSGQKGPFVFVLKPDQKAEMRKIELAGIEGDRAALASGVTEGERVIVEGQMRLVDGARAAEGISPGPRSSDASAPPGAAAAGAPQ